MNTLTNIVTPSSLENTMTESDHNKERDDNNYQLYSKHMWYLYGDKWFHLFDQDGSRYNEIPSPFYHRVQQAIREDWRIHYQKQDEYDRKCFEREAAKKAEQEIKEATLSYAEYMEWEETEYLREQEEMDRWLDNGSMNSLEANYNSDQREQDGKIWIKNKIKNGEIVIGPDGKYQYFYK